MMVDSTIFAHNIKFRSLLTILRNNGGIDNVILMLFLPMIGCFVYKSYHRNFRRDFTEYRGFDREEANRILTYYQSYQGLIDLHLQVRHIIQEQPELDLGVLDQEEMVPAH